MCLSILEASPPLHYFVLKHRCNMFFMGLYFILIRILEYQHNTELNFMFGLLLK